MADTKIYVPKQTVRRGVAGYRGKGIVIVDPTKAKAEAAAAAKKAAAEAAKGGD